MTLWCQACPPSYQQTDQECLGQQQMWWCLCNPARNDGVGIMDSSLFLSLSLSLSLSPSPSPSPSLPLSLSLSLPLSPSLSPSPLSSLSLTPYLIEVNICHDHEHPSMFSIGYPHLLSIEDPVLSVLLGTSLQCKGICSTAGFRQTVATQLQLQMNMRFYAYASLLITSTCGSNR